MKKYELYRFTKRTDIEWWNILPTIELTGQDYRYQHKTFAIALHFLCFHCRWMFWEKDHKA